MPIYLQHGVVGSVLLVFHLQLNFKYMTIKQQKEKMLAYTDFFGGNLLDFSKIKKAKTKRELKEILDDHHHFLEMQITDAKRDLDKFIKEIKLTELDI